MKKMKLILGVVIISILNSTLSFAKTPEVIMNLDDMAISVTKQQNRPVSFTNKRSGYFYTQTHSNDHSEHAWFKGYNLAQKRLFGGYQLFSNGQPLNPEDAEVKVFPHKLERQYRNALTETLFLFDDQDILKVEISNAKSQPLGITLLGEQVNFNGKTDKFITYKSSESPEHLIAIAPVEDKSFSVKEARLTVAEQVSGFYILIGKSVNELTKYLSDVKAQEKTWTAQRKQRIEEIINSRSNSYTEDADFNKALNWITVNLDQLMTKQRGYGIYAGLPWFNEYWGRDQFIALPGAALVTGQFDWARKIITSFAEYQETDPKSKYYGRVPNRLKMDDINYQTTDGTPRLIIQMMEYVKYTGDMSLISELYPVIKRSIEGSLTHWVDKKGYLIHEDNETWMDARHHPSKRAYSPRGNRANDIQALWYQQLMAGVYFAKHVEDTSSEDKWQKLADKLKSNFNKDFVLQDLDWIVDRLDENSVADTKLRPNQFFTFDLVEDKEKVAKATKEGWQQLVYPWGVASLTNKDEYFHPFHLSWDKYHKDQAYHNGTVWLWNNGIAMQRMIEVDEIDKAYELFENMNMFALKKGVVGGLAENSDAYPHQDQKWPKQTGTYLQAWSNSEHLRVWYQDFLGIRPDLINKKISLTPRLPVKLTDISTRALIGDGHIDMKYEVIGEQMELVYQFSGYNGEVLISLNEYEDVSLTVNEGDEIKIKRSEQKLRFEIKNNKEEVIQVLNLNPSIDKRVQNINKQGIMKGVDFAKPLPLNYHKVLKERYQRN